MHSYTCIFSMENILPDHTVVSSHDAGSGATIAMAGKWQIMLYTLIGRLHQKKKQIKAPLLEKLRQLVVTTITKAIVSTILNCQQFLDFNKIVIKRRKEKRMFVPEYSFLISDCVSNQYSVLSIIRCLFGFFYSKMKNQDLQSMYSRSHFTALL